MPDLPRVSQAFTADVSDYVAKMEELVAANQEFIDSIDDAIGKIGEFKAALDTLDDKNISIDLDTAHLLEQVEEVKAELDDLAEGIPVTLETGQIIAQIAQVKAELDALKQVDINVNLNLDPAQIVKILVQLHALPKSISIPVNINWGTLLAQLALLRTLLGNLGGFNIGGGFVQNINQATNAINQASNASRTYHSVWGVLTRDVQLWGGAFDSLDKTLISKIAVWHIVLDGLLEATIAVTGAVIALAGAFYALYPAGEDIYNRLKGIAVVSQATRQAIGPLTDKFREFQEAMAPRAIELYGDALNALGHGSMNALERAMAGVVDLLDKWGAEIDIWMSKSDGMAGAVTKGTGYLDQLGQMIANIVLAIQNLMKAEPGVAHFVLDFVDGFTKAFAVLTGISPMLDKIALALHGVMLWGGLLVSIFANLAVGILKPVSALLTFVARTKSATSAIEDFEAANDTAATPVQKLQLTLQAMGDAFTKMGGAVRAWAAGIGAEMAAADGVFASAGAGIMAVLDSIKAGLLALATNPFVWVAAAAAAILYLGYAFSKVADATTTWLANWNSITSSDSASQFLVDSANEISEIYGTRLPESMKTASAAMAPFYTAFHGTFSNISAAVTSTNIPGAFGHIADAVKDAGKAALDYLPDLIVGQQAQNSVNAYEQAISTLTSQQKTMFQTAGTVMKQNSVGYAQALGLMDLAGVKAGDNFDVQMAKVNGLITGYKNLGIQGGYLGSSINAVTLQSELQQSQVQALAQAWTGFINLVTGGESTFVTAVQQIQGTLSEAGGAASALSVNNGKVSNSIKKLADGGNSIKDVKVNIDALSTSGLQLKSSFLQSVQAANQNLNALQQLSVAGGQGKAGIDEVNQAGKDYVATLLPVAANSKDAQTTLFALAQQAGYTGQTAFPTAAQGAQALARWVGNLKNPMQQAEDITNKLTESAGNLARDVQNLSNAINTDLDSAMATAIAGGKGMQTAFNNAYDSLKKTGDYMSGPSKQAAGQLAGQLLQVTGNAQQAHDKFDAFYEMMGLDKTQADQLWGSVHKLATAIDSLHSKTVTLTVNQLITATQGSGYVNVSGQQISAGALAAQHASGGRIPGYGGGDIVPAMLEPGEAIVPKHLVGAIAPILSAHKVPGFASGGIVGNPNDLNAAYAALDAVMNNKSLTGVAFDNAYDAAWNRVNADKAAAGIATSGQTAAQKAAAAKAAAAQKLRLQQEAAIHKTTVAADLAVWNQQHATNVQDRALAAAQDAAAFAKFAIPTNIASPLAAPPQFLGSWLPSSLSGAGLGSNSYVSASGQPQHQLEATHPANITVNMDGKAIWNSQQKVTLRYNLRNNGIATGLQKPK